MNGNDGNGEWGTGGGGTERGAGRGTVTPGEDVTRYHPGTTPSPRSPVPGPPVFRSHRRDDVIVGLALLIGALVIVAATLWVRQAQFGHRTTAAIARFHDVGNARVGTAVLIRGVRAGRIAGLELGDDGWVRARLVLEPDARLPRNPVVVLETSSLFGEWQATILPRDEMPADPEIRRQLAAAAGEPGTIPGALTPDIGQLTATAGRIAQDVSQLATRVNATFDTSAARQLRTSIANIAAVSATLDEIVRRQAGAVDRLSTDLRSGASAFAEAGTALRRTSDRVDSATAGGEVTRIVTEAEATARTLRMTAEEMRAMSARLGQTQLALEHAAFQTDSVLTRVNTGRGSLGRLVNDSSLYQGTDSLVRELRDLVADVKKNPKKYVNVKIF